MSGSVWIWVVVLAVLIGGYWLFKNGKLGTIKLPSFGPKPTVEQIEAQTGKEKVKAEELRKVLEARRELAKVRAENIRLRKEIDRVSEKSVVKEKRDAEEAQKAKPRRL